VPEDAVPGPQEAKELARMKAEDVPPPWKGLEIPLVRQVGGQVNVAIEPGEPGEQEGEENDKPGSLARARVDRPEE
jgi:hypothetical protein